MITIKPTDNRGHAMVLREEMPVGTAHVRASRTHPGYVTIVGSWTENGWPRSIACRVPADWITELAQVPVEDSDVESGIS